MKFIKWVIEDSKERYAHLSEIVKGRNNLLAAKLGWWIAFVMLLPLAPIQYLIFKRIGKDYYKQDRA
jgi:choline-glycine betaine transporter